MRPVVITQTATGTSNLAVLDYIQQPFNVGIGVAVTGTATYTVEHTFDDVFAATYSAGAGNWYAHGATSLVGATGNGDGNYAFACRASRLNVSGTGTVTATYLQGLTP